VDNDVIIHQKNWLNQIEEVFARDPEIGICGLKRKDLYEYPGNPNPWFNSRLQMLPHKPGETWLFVEEVQHVMGTCQAYSAKLLEVIGYLYQPGLYGFDDALASVRARVAGFKTVFIPWVPIDHIDPGTTPFSKWKEKYSGGQMDLYNRLKAEFQSGERPVYCRPDEEFTE
jgi:GT2 family glycosyltransferase